MSKAAVNLQDSFLNQVRRENSEVRVLLVNGTLLRGTVKGFDNFTVILNNRNGQHLIYKHAVAQIVTHKFPSKSEESAAPETTEDVHEPEAVASEPAAPAKAEVSAGSSSKPKPKKDGFNKLDLSQVKLGDEKK